MPGAISAMGNIFVDPALAVKYIPRKFSWAWPLAVTAAVSMFIGFRLAPLVLRVFRENPPERLSPEQVERAVSVLEVSQRVASFGAPFTVAALTALSAVILLAMCRMLDIPAKLHDLFSLCAHCGLIHAAGGLAGYIVIQARADQIHSMEELQPSIGVGMFVSDAVSKPALAVLQYFSIFTLWYIVILGLALAFLTGVPKTRAYIATIPVWLLPLALAVTGALLRR